MIFVVVFSLLTGLAAFLVLMNREGWDWDFEAVGSSFLVGCLLFGLGFFLWSGVLYVIQPILPYNYQSSEFESISHLQEQGMYVGEGKNYTIDFFVEGTDTIYSFELSDGLYMVSSEQVDFLVDPNFNPRIGYDIHSLPAFFIGEGAYDTEKTNFTFYTRKPMRFVEGGQKKLENE